MLVFFKFFLLKTGFEEKDTIRKKIIKQLT